MKKATLNYRGMGPFLPYPAIEEAIRDAGIVEAAVDPEAVGVLVAWARHRGYTVSYTQDTVVISRATTVATKVEEAEPTKTQPTQEQKEAKPPTQPTTLQLVVAGEWRSDISEKLADLTFIVGAILRAPILHRGPSNTSSFASAIGREKVLARLQLEGQDYILYIEKGVVKAAAQPGTPLTPEQAKTIIDRIASSNPQVTAYDASNIL